MGLKPWIMWAFKVNQTNTAYNLNIVLWAYVLCIIIHLEEVYYLVISLNYFLYYYTILLRENNQSFTEEPYIYS
jgi:hypothetical protein